MPSASVRLFVYGSLKRGGRHHDELAGARFLGLAETEPGYRLEPLGEYLALVPAAPPETGPEPEPETVTGELFEVDESRLAGLDAFEGDGYYRGQLKVRPLLVLHPPPGRDRAQTEHECEAGVIALAYLKKAR